MIINLLSIQSLELNKRQLHINIFSLKRNDILT
jgi:hypothetical protein